ncbi:MAG: 2-oxo-4-hydroxy-4-carboxy-5-ureidoimidazoline decarboxylase [Opitutaceae bacterium]
MKKYSLTQLNAFELPDFVEALSTVYEHSPWVIADAAKLKPFGTVKALQTACETVLYGASVEKQIALIQAHPDLAVKLDQLPKLTDFSQAEQSRAGFAALPSESLDELRVSLEAYREQFGHPFILCVTEHPATDVLSIVQMRLQADADAERIACCCQIARIGWHRLCSIVET